MSVVAVIYFFRSDPLFSLPASRNDKPGVTPTVKDHPSRLEPVPVICPAGIEVLYPVIGKDALEKDGTVWSRKDVTGIP